MRSRFVRLSDIAVTRLAPGLAAALTEDPAGSEDPAATNIATPFLDDEDRRVLDETRRAVKRWLTIADRIPPAELLDGIVEETGYAFELAGPRRRQAWERLSYLTTSPEIARGRASDVAHRRR